MAISNQNIEMFAGDSKILQVSVVDSAGAVVDITGCIIKWAAVKGSTNVIYKDTSNGITINDGVHGKYRIRLNPLDTKTIVGTFYHESEVTDAFGDVSTVLKGNIKILPSYV